MSYSDEDLLQLSGIQHFAFCRRQWALIHIEKQWVENWRTADGRIMHKRAHDITRKERRGDTLIFRGMSVVSRTLGISGQCDIVEFHLSSDGITLKGEEGLWTPYPVEYKRGAPKSNNVDEAQLCAQAMCLEETLGCKINEGALFYGENRRRTKVIFDEQLRAAVKEYLTEMHSLYRRGYTPKVKPNKACLACSLNEICLPRMMKAETASTYLNKALKEEL